MTPFPEGNAIVYCEGAFGTPNGKTAHGLVRRTRRYRVVAVIDSRFAGHDAGDVLDGKRNGVAIYRDVGEAITALSRTKNPPSHLVVGLAPDGGRLDVHARKDLIEAIRLGVNVDSGLHDFLSEDPEIAGLAKDYGVQLRDVRRTPPRKDLHAFSGKIEAVTSLKVAVLGTDSAVGKRTTAWLLVDGLHDAGFTAELIGTGQTAWMQGARYSIILDSLINDFVAGEIEHAVWSAWSEQKADAIVIEGQGSLLNPAYPGGFEILAAGRPDLVVLQHAPARKEYDGFPGYRLHPLERQIEAIQLIAEKPIVAIAVNHENLPLDSIGQICAEIKKQTGLPAVDVLLEGASKVVEVLVKELRK